ncbi:MAG: thiamine diphosphokinase [Lachnospiraceae bacterium]|jgi:thiamine pyrophosphokinase|nr:thiamine diphosphokinase [Lachnospiraceae bacterium]
MSRKTIIISGGTLPEQAVLEILKEHEGASIIGVDRGMEFLYRHGIKPDYLVGDFDSVSEEIADYYRNKTRIPIREFNPQKDVSDTEIAVRMAMTLGGKKILILGATGGRLDHLWANIQTLKVAFQAGADAEIIDSQNRIRLIKDVFTLKKEDAFGKYFSVFPFGEAVYGVTIKGAKYNLDGKTLEFGNSLTVSNEIIGSELSISSSSGILIFMETKD